MRTRRSKEFKFDGNHFGCKGDEILTRSLLICLPSVVLIAAAIASERYASPIVVKGLVIAGALVYSFVYRRVAASSSAAPPHNNNLHRRN